MLTEICADLRNYFCRNEDKHIGTFEISGGTIALPFLKEGQYFRIIGSVFSDGVHQYPVSGLTDETFSGAVWAMRIPPAVIALAAEIEEYQKSDAAKPSAFTAESFGGYSYSKKENTDWRSVFAGRLNKWRKL